MTVQSISWKWLIAICIVLAAVAGLFPLDAYAQVTISGETCSHDAQFDIPYTLLVPGDGLISGVVSDLQDILEYMAWYMYTHIIISESFSWLIPKVLTLYILIYGVFFTFGMVQVTLYDFLARMTKIALVMGVLFLPGVYTSFFWFDIFNMLFTFFTDGTNAIIAKITSVAVGGVSVTYDPNYPFAILDEAIAKLVSAKMAVTMLATIFTGPYGLIFGFLLLFASGSFVMALFTAMWVYLMAMVLRALLLALTPMFILFLLFDKTRHLFNGWLNQLVNTSLQPILLFTFFAFFVTLISASVDHLLETPVCWTFVPEAWRGGPTNLYFWRFAVPNDGSGPPGPWMIFKGLWSWVGAETNPPDPSASPFPIDIMDILIFLILAELAGRFNGIITTIARDLAGASTDFASMQGPLGQWFAPDKGADTNLANNVGRRNTPGGVGYAGPEAAKALEDVKRGVNRQGALDYVNKISDNLGRRG
jgi:type IV secretory pathway VirB6-like protein